MWLSPVERCVRVAEVPGSNPGTPIEIVPSLHTARVVQIHATAHTRTMPWPDTGSGIVRWSAGRMANALASKASVRKDLGVRIPRAPLGNYQMS